jgi:hypothetical protein
VAGASDGSISVFELGKPGKERFIKQVAHFQGMPGVSVYQNKLILVSSGCLEREKQRDSSY